VSEALNSTWRVNVSGQVYGPYTGHQLRAFAAEGRIAAHSIVQSGDGPWITAIDDPVLGQLFVQKAEKQPPPAQQPQGFGVRGAAVESVQGEPQSANFIIIADLRSRGSAPFEGAIARMGEAYRLNQLVWLVHTERTAAAIRNELVQHVGQSDNLMIVDTTRGKSAWFNLGPEVDSKIRRVWKRPADKGNS
jgi:hypothetical protein